MKIKGFQKLTLVDYPGKIACTIFLFGCNFRCGFCYNPELVIQDTNETISSKEILDFLEKRKGKLEGVCITGGEALLTLDKEFLIKIKQLGYPIKLDTNGYLPNKLKEFIDENLIDAISMDLKSSKENYSKTAGVNINIKKIEESIKLIVNSGLDYEFRTTIVPEIHTEEEMISLGKWVSEICQDRPEKYFLQGFKNSGKFIDNKYQNKKNTTEAYLKKISLECNKYFKEIGIRC